MKTLLIFLMLFFVVLFSKAEQPNQPTTQPADMCALLDSVYNVFDWYDPILFYGVLISNDGLEKTYESTLKITPNGYGCIYEDSLGAYGYQEVIAKKLTMEEANAIFNIWFTKINDCYDGEDLDMDAETYEDGTRHATDYYLMYLDVYADTDIPGTYFVSFYIGD